LKPPPAGRLRGAKPSSLIQHRIKELRNLHGRLLSAFMAHSASIINTQLRVRLRVGVLLPGTS